MSDKVTIDFERELVTWETDAQNGTETCPGIAARKSQILAAMGYKSVNITPAVNAFNDLVNGEIDKEEFFKRIEEFSNDEEE